MSQFESLGLPLIHAGKVREMYALPAGDVLMVATDNISAFDYILPTPIPGKGAVLTQLSLWWFERLRDLVPDHVVSVDVPDAVKGRAIVVEKLDMVPVECVARGYLTGSGWVEYQRSRTVCGVPLPDGLRDARLHGDDLATRLRDLTLEVYARAEHIAAGRGIILADTKVEFGRRDDGTLVLAVEVLTPASSLFWDAELWRPGESLPSFDKQYVRDWLAEESGWDRETTPPELPAEVIDATRARYIEAYERLTGQRFQDPSA